LFANFPQQKRNGFPFRVPSRTGRIGSRSTGSGLEVFYSNRLTSEDAKQITNIFLTATVCPDYCLHRALAQDVIRFHRHHDFQPTTNI
jgi:hypothetical protein